jgi:hypothetical protein
MVIGSTQTPVVFSRASIRLISFCLIIALHLWRNAHGAFLPEALLVYPTRVDKQLAFAALRTTLPHVSALLQSVRAIASSRAFLLPG